MLEEAQEVLGHQPAVLAAVQVQLQVQLQLMHRHSRVVVVPEIPPLPALVLTAHQVS